MNKVEPDIEIGGSGILAGDDLSRYLKRRERLEKKKLSERAPFKIIDGERYWLVRSYLDGYTSQIVHTALKHNAKGEIIEVSPMPMFKGRTYIKKQCFLTEEEAKDANRWLNLTPGQ